MIDALSLGVQHQHPIHMASLADVATNDSMRFTLVLYGALFFDTDDDGASLNDAPPLRYCSLPHPAAPVRPRAS